ncbi:MAG: hypothetical protein ACRD6W_05050 [Nitrososphaerales archaeon]
MKKSVLGLLAAVSIVPVGLLFSACGGSATPGVASLSGKSPHTSNPPSSGTAGSGTKRQDSIKFAKCMRSHGVKTFPESSNGRTVKIGSGSGIDPNSPTFQAAQKACQSLLPKPSPAQIRQAEQNALELSKCMRAHGVPNFPDPQFSTGGASIKISAGSGGLNPTSPAFQSAQKACSKYMHLPKGKGGPGKPQAVYAP